MFVDVDKDTMGLSPCSLLSFIEKNVEIKNDRPINKNTGRVVSACVPMHTYGMPCRITEIAEICKFYNIPLVEDAAESLGSFTKVNIQEDSDWLVLVLTEIKL